MLVPTSSPDTNYFLLDPEHPNARWVDRDRFHFHCKFNESESNMPCNLVYMLSVDSVNGTDLSNFDYFNLDIKYTGNAKKLRIAFRHYDSRFSKVSDTNSTKFNVLNVRTKDLTKPLMSSRNSLTILSNSNQTNYGK